MKVLFVVPWIPWPLVNGGKIRTYHLLREAAKRAEIHLHLVREREPIPDAAEELARFCAAVTIHERGTPSPWFTVSRPKFERWFHSPSLAAAIAREGASGTYDVVHLDELAVARLVPAAARAAVVQHHHKLDTVLYEALNGEGDLAARFDLWKLRRLEAYSLRRFRHQLLCSEGDGEILRERYGPHDFGAIPSGFDSQLFRRAESPAPREAHRLLFLGSMDYGPNVDGVRWFVEQVLEAIRAADPDVLLEIVGADPPPEIRELAGDHIHVTGRVPDVRPHLERASAMVVPLRIGGGTRLKIVEALALGTPVVSTTIGAEGLDLVADEHLRLADDPASFATAVTGLLADPAAAAALAERGRAFVHARYRWEALGDRLVDYWERAD